MKIVDQPFSLQHLPYGIVDFGETVPHLSVRLDDTAVSLAKLQQAGLLPELSGRECSAYSLNPLLKLPRPRQLELRDRLAALLSDERHCDVEGATLELAPYPDDDPRVLSPISPGDYVDFYCSRHHAFRVGCLFRGPEQALPEQYFDLPIGYHGRSSTLQVSGQPVARPRGITAGPVFGPSQRLDYELELAYLLRPCRGALTPDQASEAIFGVLLLNDWSARDIQAFEYRPLGPFLGKSFATSVAAWVTPMEALSRWRQPNRDSDHPVLPHLQERGEHHLDLPLWAELQAQDDSLEICTSNASFLAWSPAQMLAHLTSNGTVIRAGDLIASGTVSGPETGAEGCLLERTAGGKDPIALSPSGQERRFLQDEDEVTLLGGHPGVGLAPCRARILPCQP